MSLSSTDVSSSEEEASFEAVVYTSDELLKIGLRLVNYTVRRIKRATRKTNIERFVGHFGGKPDVISLIWEDLQLTDNEEAKIGKDDLFIDHYLMALHALKRYPTELEREAAFDISHAYGRDWVWFFVYKIRCLKYDKILWPEDNFGDDLWVITVDGTHCWIQEPRHESWSMDTRYFSHKFGKAALNYELGIALSTSRLVWMNGPFPAGESDNKTFKTRGLMKKLEETGKRGIADGGYPGHPQLLSTPNNHDSKAVKKFKSRALKRHEKFNGMTKTFGCLSGRFRHSIDRFTHCFEAVCVICQYQLENGEPLYDIMIEELLK